MNTAVNQVDPNTFLLVLEQADTVNHVVVFLTGQVPFSEGYGGSIYIGWPSPEAGISWQLLGYISNQKPSAIFKLVRVKPSDMVVNPFSQELMDTMVIQQPTHAQVGIMVEPLAEIVQKTPANNTEASTVHSYTEFSQKMLESFFNYASSFSTSPSTSPMDPSGSYVPMGVLQQWYSNFQRRLQANPHFWKTL